MITCIKKVVSDRLAEHPKLQQWLWFIVLWCGGLATVLVLTYPLRLLIKFCQ